jgi:RNA polymerase sigma-32 factor
LVAKIALGYRGHGLPVDELISEGNVGVLKAVRGFNPDRGFRFATYAMLWIRAAICEYILHNWSMVKITTTSAQKKLFFNLRRLKREMHAIDEGDLEPEQVSAVAQTLGVPELDVIRMNWRLASTDHSLNAPIGLSGDVEWQDRLIDEIENQECVLADRQESDARKAILSVLLKTLDKRELHILTERRLKEKPPTLEELALQYGISRERVRQIEVDAVRKMRSRVHSRQTDRVGVRH